MPCWMSLIVMVVMLSFSTACHAANSPSSQNVFTPWQFGAKNGDCTSDNSAALNSAAKAAVSTPNGVLWTGDSCLAFGGTTWTPPAHLVWRSDFTEQHRLLWVGQQNISPIEVTNSLDVDGVILDLQRPANVVRSGSSVTQSAVGFGIHGSMETDRPAYLSGVKIGRLKVENGTLNTAIAFVNIKDLVADQLIVEHNWGQGIMLAGVTHAQVNQIATKNIGNLGTQSNRAGQSVALFAEADPRKKPASWYEIAWKDSATLANAQPCRNVLPMDDVRIGSIQTWGNTDTDVYIHDYGPDDNSGFQQGGRPATCNGEDAPIGWGTGVGHITIGSIAATLAGKDELKVRRWAHDVHVDKLEGHYLGGRAFACEVWCHDFSIDSVTIDAQSPYDVVAVLKNDKAGSDLYTNDQQKGSPTYNGTDQTLSTVAVGGYIEHAEHVIVKSGTIKNIGGLSYNPVAEGYCLQIDASNDVKIGMACMNNASSALRMSDTQNFVLNVTSEDACRGQQGKSCYGFYVTNDGDGDSHDGELRWSMSETTPSGFVTAPVRINGAASNINLTGNTSGYPSLIIDPKASNIRSN